MGNKDSKTHPADEEVTTLLQIFKKDQFTMAEEKTHIIFANGNPWKFY